MNELTISAASIKFTYGNCIFVKFSSILSNNFEQEIDTCAKYKIMPSSKKSVCSVSQNEASPSAVFVISASEHAHNVIPFYCSSRRLQT